MIYNPFQGIIVTNGQSQFVLPQGGGQDQLMMTIKWPGRPDGRVRPNIRGDKGLSEAELTGENKKINLCTMDRESRVTGLRPPSFLLTEIKEGTGLPPDHPT